jgi:hypothetical protein
MIMRGRRSFEEFTLLNSAFCASLVASCATGWRQQVATQFPFAYSFLVLPVTLHGPTRYVLPRTIRTSMANWTQEHPDVKVGFAERAKSLRLFTKEAILFGVSQELFSMKKNGDLSTNQSATVIHNWGIALGGESGLCISKAFFLGRWLGTSATLETTLALWGVSV